MFFVVTSILLSFPQSYYLYPDNYLDFYRDQRRQEIIENRRLTTQCFPCSYQDYNRKFTYDSIDIFYTTGVYLKGIYEDEELAYQADIPILLHANISENYGIVGSGYFHFGHEGGKTDEQKIVGFAPGFEMPVEEFFIYLKKDRLTVEFGRRRVFWGPANYTSLFLSENLSYDMIRLSYHGDKIHFENIITPLDTKIDKYMALQRVEISLFNGKFLFGINEGVVWSKRLGEYYLIPISPYYLIQRYSAERPDNVLGGADIQMILGSNYRLYAQGLVDDVSFSPPEPPEKLGFIFGIDMYNIFSKDGLDLNIEFSGVSPYTYAHYSYHLEEVINGFNREDTCAGHNLGNNFWDGKLEVSYNNEKFAVSSLFGYTIQGPYDVSDPWTWDHRPNPPWPEGVVQKTLYIFPEFSVQMADLNFSILFEYYFIKNSDFTVNLTTSLSNLKFDIYYQLPF